MAPPPPFRVYAKNYLLTYPQCPLSKEEALFQIKALTTPLNKTYIRVHTELNENGEPRIDALVQFDAKLECTNKRFFDLVSPTRPAHFHPIIQGSRSASHVNAYLAKHGDFTEWGEFQIEQQIPQVYSYVLNASSKSEALQMIREKDPRRYVLQLRNLDAKLSKIFAPPRSVYTSNWDPSSFIVPDRLRRWVSENIVASERPRRPMSLVLEGPSRIGKTEWARSLGLHNYMAGCMDLSPEGYSNDVAYNVIDNIEPRELKKKHWKELIGAQRDWEATYKYCGRSRLRIKGGIPAIVICNPGRGWSYEEFLEEKKNAELKQWTLERAEFYTIEAPLFAPPLPPSNQNE